MSIWAIHEPTGKITAVIMGSVESARMNTHENQSVLELAYHCDPASHYIRNGDVVEYPVRPSDYVKFDFVMHQWVSDDVVASLALRDERNRRLKSSDWTQVPDAPVDREAWAEYRQALRDLPANTDDPRNVVWPEPPV